MKVFPETDDDAPDRPGLSCADGSEMYFADEVELISHMQGALHGGEPPRFDP